MSNNIYADQHKLPGSKLFKDIEVPPRKLLLQNNKKSHHHHHHHHHHQELINCGSPGSSSYIVYPEEMNNLHKFLPFNNTDADSDSHSDPYASDHFRMYEFKIRRCTRSRSHDWTDCPFAHPSEKARRRDPCRYHYSGTVCSEYRRVGGCSRGDDCEFAHGVFECWLHPSRYRTEACKDGKNCKRKVCFFAHSPRQLRIFPELSSSPTKYSSLSLSSSPSSINKNMCCMYCHNQSVNSSPTSTLLEKASHFSRSPSLSPPLSPVKHGYSPVSRYGTSTTDWLSKFSNSEMSISYKDMLNELMMSFNDVSISSPMSAPPTTPWIDVNLFNVDQDQQQQFVLSPSTPSPSGSMNPFGHADQHLISNNFFVEDHNTEGLASTPDPDLGWVNELLM